MAAETIFALSSGAGRAAIAIVRLSGPDVRAVLTALIGTVPPPRRARLAMLRAPSGLILDQALVLFFPGPNSETGEDVGELHLHGSRAVVQAVLQTLGGFDGLGPAEPGEFARRALACGKMDLLDVEALADLIDADTEAQRRQALAAGGSLLRGVAEGWREIILSVRAELEARIDFEDEADVADRLDSQAEQRLRVLIDRMTEALTGAKRGELVRGGFKVVLAGPPNAGKSSLLNALARREVAIVSAVPGTTRDRIEVSFDIDGIPVTLIDTAGLRFSDDAIEQEGIRRTRQAALEADLVLWLSPADAPQPPDVDGDVRIVGTKSDLGRQECWHELSVQDGIGIDALLRKLGREAEARLSGDSVLLTRQRHVTAIGEAKAALMSAVAMIAQPELCSEGLRLAERRLDGLLGRIDIEDVLGEIFSRFCVGK